LVVLGHSGQFLPQRLLRVHSWVLLLPLLLGPVCTTSVSVRMTPAAAAAAAALTALAAVVPGGVTPAPLPLLRPLLLLLLLLLLAAQARKWNHSQLYTNGTARASSRASAATALTAAAAAAAAAAAPAASVMMRQGMVMKVLIRLCQVCPRVPPISRPTASQAVMT
jgi:hypothetical protein